MKNRRLKPTGGPSRATPRLWHDIFSAILKPMSVEQSDTHPAVERIVIDLLRQTSTSRKLAMMEELNQLGRSLIMSDLRERHPGASDKELRRLLADRLLGSDMAAK